LASFKKNDESPGTALPDLQIASFTLAIHDINVISYREKRRSAEIALMENGVQKWFFGPMLKSWQ